MDQPWDRPFKQDSKKSLSGGNQPRKRPIKQDSKKSLSRGNQPMPRVSLKEAPQKRKRLSKKQKQQQSFLDILNKAEKKVSDKDTKSSAPVGSVVIYNGAAELKKWLYESDKELVDAIFLPRVQSALYTRNLRWFVFFPKLRILNLFGTLVNDTEQRLAWKTELPQSIEVLNLSRTYISTVGPSILRLSGLVDLQLNGCSVLHNIKNITVLINLKHLGISMLRLDHGLKFLKNLTELVQLDMAGTTGFKSEDVDYLEHLIKLERLDVTNSSLVRVSGKVTLPENIKKQLRFYNGLDILTL